MTQNLLRKSMTLCLLCVLVAFCGTLAQAAPVTFVVNVNTASITGTNGFINLQLNPGGPSAELATATVFGFAQVGGNLALTSTNIGSAAGTLPGAVTLTNTTPLNDLFQGDLFGSSLGFSVTLDGPALDPPSGNTGSVFSVSLLGASGMTPLLTTNMDGFLLQILVNPSGSTSVVNFGTSFVTVTQAGAPIPEPTTMLLLSSGLAGAAGFVCRRRRR